MDAQSSPEVNMVDRFARSCPANTLPLDILHYFFTATYLFYMDDAEKESDDAADQFATQVSHVCQSWRNAALQTPGLWTHLVFAPEDAVVGFRRQQLWIERSRSLPLEIWIDGDPIDVGDPWGDNPASIMGEIRSRLLPVAARWKWLMLSEIPIDAIKVLFENLLDVSAPALLQVHVQRREELLTPAGWIFRAFSATPQLTSLEIGDIPVDLGIPTLRAPSLQAVCFSDISFSPNINVAMTELMNLLKELVSLEVLEMEQGQIWEEVDPGEGSQSTAEPFLHANLHSIINVHQKLVDRLLPLIKTPNLSTLTDISFDAYSIICNSPSPPNLRRLGIHNGIPSGFDDAALLSGFFDVFPDLTHLELGGFDFVNHDSWRLLFSRVPKLTSLQLCVYLGLKEEYLRHLIQSRIGAGMTRLTELTVMGRGATVVEGMENWEASLSSLVDKVEIMVSRR